MGVSDDDSSQESECNSGGVRPKELVHKCASDPGKDGGGAKSLCGRSIAGPAAGQRYPSGATTRKCVLTLDGYSYVIGEYDSIVFLF